ncbi:CinA family protein [Acuticoccus sp. M5D2P5]|uniref:CinA family protein n=1 Tax=Acuticoccus kalidii TaxID=2910977 RepID=UPI001F29A655|nr:CinA family protein [Acuticoccus kalidii]MCF3932660.1 CinA family protein [Acuticoccus kalidii]
MFDDEIRSKAEAVLDAARARGVMLATAESCTGGLVAGALTAIAGSSDAVDGGFVTYSNAAKVQLGVPEALLVSDGAVSERTARALARAAREAALARAPKGAERVAVSVTGVAGPGGGSAEKPVGLVHFAIADAAGTRHRVARFGDVGRDEVRRRSILTALDLLLESLAAPITV